MSNEIEGLGFLPVMNGYEATRESFKDIFEMHEYFKEEEPEKIVNFKGIHGIVNPIFTDEEYSHGWALIDDSSVYQVFIDRETKKKAAIGMPLESFEKLYRPTELTTYSIAELKDLRKKTRTTGPWQYRYVRLCSGIDPEILPALDFVFEHKS